MVSILSPGFYARKRAHGSNDESYFNKSVRFIYLVIISVLLAYLMDRFGENGS